MPSKPMTCCLLMVAACLMAASKPGEKYRLNSYQGKAPPELVSKTEHWMGTTKAICLSKLKGKVVWLQFNF